MSENEESIDTVQEYIKPESEEISTEVLTLAHEDFNMRAPLPQLAMEVVPDEPPRSTKAFQDYMNMGKGRTLELLAREYIKPEYDKSRLGNKMGWTDNFESVFRQLKEYSTKFGWQGRKNQAIAGAAASVLAGAQKQAYLNTKERIIIAGELQRLGMTIIRKAELEKLSVAEARKLLKAGHTMVHLGLTSEREETGDVLASIRPHKPLRDMSDEELEEYAESMSKALR